MWSDEELPWYHSNLQIQSQTLRLHNEIVEINNLLRPVPSEDAQRIEARDLIDTLIKAIFPTARLEVRTPSFPLPCSHGSVLLLACGAGYAAPV